MRYYLPKNCVTLGLSEHTMKLVTTRSDESFRLSLLNVLGNKKEENQNTIEWTSTVALSHYISFLILLVLKYISSNVFKGLFVVLLAVNITSKTLLQRCFLCLSQCTLFE